MATAKTFFDGALLKLKLSRIAVSAELLAPRRDILKQKRGLSPRLCLASPV
jgi:hypothetical protein